MRPLLTAVIAVIVITIVYLLIWPVPIEPLAWEAPEPPAADGPFAPNDRLAAVRRIDLAPYSGPEDLAIGADGLLYSTSHEGAVLRIAADGSHVDAVAQTGGRPLGIDAAPDGALYVANAFLGLQRVRTDGTVEPMLNQVNGRALRFANDVAVAADGSVYFSESSAKFGAADYGGTLEASLVDILEHGGHGFVALFEPASGTARVLVDGLNFANGVAVDDQETYLLIAETGSYRVLKHWLDGPQAGTTEVVVDNLPGFPDNVDNGIDGRFWIGLVAPRNALLDKLSTRPFLRRVVQRLPAFLRPRPARSSHVIAIAADGTVLASLQDSSATHALLTGAAEIGEMLFLSSLEGHALLRLDAAALACCPDGEPR